MRIFHSRDCRYSPMFPHCDCGAVEDAEELERLREVVASIERLIESAETIVIQSNTHTPFRPKMVHASDLADVISGRLR